MRYKERERGMKKTKKDEIIESAIDLMYLNGYQDTKVEDITHKAGVAKGTFYTYFNTKEDLIVSIIEDGAKKYWEMGEKFVIEKKGVRENLKGLAILELRYAIENQRFFVILISLILNEINMGTKIKQVVFSEEKKGCRVIKRILKEAQKNGELKKFSDEKIEYLSVIVNHMFKFHLAKTFFEMPTEEELDKKPTIKKGKINVDIEKESDFIVGLILDGILK